MFQRWLARYRWRCSTAFERDVLVAMAEMCGAYGENALEQSRRKARRRGQRMRRKWVWKEVVKRLESQQASHVLAKSDTETAQSVSTRVFQP